MINSNNRRGKNKEPGMKKLKEGAARGSILGAKASALAWGRDSGTSTLACRWKNRR